MALVRTDLRATVSDFAEMVDLAADGDDADLDSLVHNEKTSKAQELGEEQGEEQVAEESKRGTEKRQMAAKLSDVSHEKVKEGGHSYRALCKYIGFGGGPLWVCAVLVLGFAAYGVYGFTDIWLAWWVSTKETASLLIPVQLARRLWGAVLSCWSCFCAGVWRAVPVHRICFCYKHCRASHSPQNC